MINKGNFVAFGDGHAGRVLDFMNDGTMAQIAVPERHNGKRFFCAGLDTCQRLFTAEQFHTEENRFDIVAAEVVKTYEGIYALAMKQERRGDFNRLIELIPAAYALHKRAVLLRDWFDLPEPVGTRKMSSETSSTQQKMNNADEIGKMVEGKVYILYDHVRNAFWGPDCGGYQYRKNAGLYTSAKAAEVVGGSNRFFTIQEVPVEVLTAMREAM